MLSQAAFRYCSSWPLVSYKQHTVKAKIVHLWLFKHPFPSSNKLLSVTSRFCRGNWSSCRECGFRSRYGTYCSAQIVKFTRAGCTHSSAGAGYCRSRTCDLKSTTSNLKTLHDSCVLFTDEQIHHRCDTSHFVNF